MLTTPVTTQRVQRAAMWCALVALAGLGACGYLIYLHLGLLRGEFLGGAACGSGVFNCHAVTASPWASVLGIPLAFWGALGYLTVLALALLVRQSADGAERSMRLLAACALIFVLLDVGLLVVMVRVIRFICVFCVLTYALNLLLLIITVRALSPGWLQALGRAPAALSSLVPTGRDPAVSFFWALVLTGTLATVGLHAAILFLTEGDRGELRERLQTYLREQPRVSVGWEEDPILGPPPRRPRESLSLATFCVRRVSERPK